MTETDRRTNSPHETESRTTPLVRTHSTGPRTVHPSTKEKPRLGRERIYTRNPWGGRKGTRSGPKREVGGKGEKRTKKQRDWGRTSTHQQRENHAPETRDEWDLKCRARRTEGHGPPLQPTGRDVLGSQVVSPRGTG